MGEHEFGFTDWTLKLRPHGFRTGVSVESRGGGMSVEITDELTLPLLREFHAFVGEVLAEAEKEAESDA